MTECNIVVVTGTVIEFYLTLFVNCKLSAIICFTNCTSPPGYILSASQAVLTEAGRGLASDLVSARPQASS